MTIRHVILPRLLAPILAAVVATGSVVRAADSTSELRGRSVYERACAACHGYNGDGSGPAARYLVPRPRNFKLGLYKLRSTPTGMPPTDDDLYRTVSEGIPTTWMPAFGHILSERERRDVVAYIKAFSRTFAAMRAVEPVSIPEEPADSAKAVGEGRDIYILSGCWTCHGPEGRGDGEAAASLINASGQPIVPVDFTRGLYKSGHDNRSLFRTLHTGFNGTPMPSYAATLLFTGDRVSLPSTITDTYSASEIATVRSYWESQPTAEEIAGFDEAERDALVSERTWALVYYLRSLAKDPSIWHKLFAEDTEVTK